MAERSWAGVVVSSSIAPVPNIAPARDRSETSNLPAAVASRDGRLDFFRGWLQLSIFIAHVPDNVAAWLLHRNFGFSNASEMFVLSSGFTLGSIFAARSARYSRAAALADLIRRLVHLYRRHLTICASLIAVVIAVALTTHAPDEIAGAGLMELLNSPGIALAHLALLGYQPVFLDILPLFLVLIPLVALVCATPRRLAALPLLVSITVYGLTQWTGAHLTTWPDNAPWTFNPYAWQLLLVIGASAGRRVAERGFWLPQQRVLEALALLFVLFSAIVCISGLIRYHIDPAFPAQLYDRLHPLADGRNLSPLVLVHALALCVVATRLVSADASFFRWPLSQAIARCGRMSLEVFSLGVLLSVVAHLVLAHVSGGAGAQLLVSAAGVTILVCFARYREEVKLRHRVLASANAARAPKQMESHHAVPNTR